ncbi:hypothetical protein, partial [Jatrophihabitans endophyticus]|uniref:hypothetical protein n=1 Tax=Jatrophihabitans endophyticus TaxID=1206085 RepID=UPI0019E67BD1
MPVRRRLIAAATAALATIALTTGLSTGTADAAKHASGAGITVQGKQVLRNGKPFTSRGVIFEGFQFPLEAMQPCAAQKPSPTQTFCQRHV